MMTIAQIQAGVVGAGAGGITPGGVAADGGIGLAMVVKFHSADHGLILCPG